MAFLSLSRVSKNFGGIAAVTDADFDIAAGEFVSLVGPSGCGKSTLLRVIAGLIPPSQGSVTWTGEKPPIGFVFQDATLMPWSDALTNARLPLDLQGVARGAANDRASRALERLGLAGFEKSYPRQLSGGMKMRVSIARALAAKPKMLLLDEPFAALDEITRAALNNDLLALARQDGITVFFVTHSVAESVYLSDRVLVMSSRPGRIVRDIMLGPRERGAHYRLSPQFLDDQRRVADALAPRSAA